MHFVYEALNTSKKAKLGISYSLLRKPLQEILAIFELMLIDMDYFTDKLSKEPEKLYSQSFGGIEPHRKRIEKVISVLKYKDWFDTGYITQLRYDKSAEDGFDGICNKAVHLFTSSAAIKTKPMNINFIFSNWESKETQWSFLYSRLPYLLIYSQQVVEKLCATICLTTQDYLDDIDRRNEAAIILWSKTIKSRYMNEPIEKLIKLARENLEKDCLTSGFRIPKEKDLYKMMATGSYPGENSISVIRRNRNYSNIEKLNIKKNSDH